MNRIDSHQPINNSYPVHQRRGNEIYEPEQVVQNRVSIETTNLEQEVKRITELEYDFFSELLNLIEQNAENKLRLKQFLKHPSIIHTLHKTNVQIEDLLPFIFKNGYCRNAICEEIRWWSGR